MVRNIDCLVSYVKILFVHKLILSFVSTKHRFFFFLLCKNWIFICLWWPKSVDQRFQAFKDIYGAKAIKKIWVFNGEMVKKKWRKQPWCTIVGCNAQALILVLKQWQCLSASSIQVECLSAPSYIDCPLQKKKKLLLEHRWWQIGAFRVF